jgi:peptide/nickel transport system substrate-binding protein
LKKKLKLSRPFAGLVALALLAASMVIVTGGAAGAAGAVHQATDPSQAGCTKAREGGELTYGEFAAVGTIDPFDRSASGAGGGGPLAALYDTLLRNDPTTGEVVPYVAQSISHNADFTQFTLKLRPGVKFGNGDPLDAAAVVASQQRYMSTGGYYASLNNLIASIVAVDSMTVQYNMKKPFAGLTNSLSAGFGMISNTAVVNKLGKTAFGTATFSGAGVGPYELADYHSSTNIVFQAKDNYWGGPVCIKTLHFVLATSSQQALDSFNTGQYGAMYLRDPIALKQWQTAKPRTGNAVTMLVGSATDININTQSKSAHLDDVRVRQAIQYGVDRDAVNQRGFQGTLLVHSGLAPKELKIVKAPQGPKYDPAKAKKLLNAVKSETGWDGSIRLNASNTSVDYSIALAAVLNNLGFKVTLDNSKSTAGFITDINNGNYDLGCGGLQAVNGDFWNALLIRTSGQPFNYAHYNNPDWTNQVDELNASVVGTPAYDKTLAKVQAMKNELVPEVAIGSFSEATLMQKNLKNVEYSYSLLPLFGNAYLAKS